MKLDGNLVSFMVIGLALFVGSLRLTGAQGLLFRIGGLTILVCFTLLVVRGHRKR